MTNDGKVYSIAVQGGSYALMELQHDLFHGVTCLKGIARTLGSHQWIEGRRVYIPIEQIIAISEFESWPDFVASCKGAENVPSRIAAPAAGKARGRPKARKRR